MKQTYSESLLSEGKQSRDYSTATPYIIPSQLMDQTKNLRSMIYHDKSQYDGRKSFADTYYVKSKYELASDTATRYQLRPSVKPKVPNKLHLQLPQKQRVTVKRYVGQQKELQQKVSGVFGKIFKCCVTSTLNEDDYEECDYCEHRYYKEGRLEQKQRNNNDTQPYISYKRLAERQRQPIQVFYQEITNEQIQGNRFGDQKNHPNSSSTVNKSQRHY